VVVKRQNHAVVGDVYFSVEENNSREREELETIKVSEYLVEQGFEEYDKMSRQIRDNVIRKQCK
jgi:hypothetical protein